MLHRCRRWLAPVLVAAVALSLMASTALAAYTGGYFVYGDPGQPSTQAYTGGYFVY